MPGQGVIVSRRVEQGGRGFRRICDEGSQGVSMFG